MDVITSRKCFGHLRRSHDSGRFILDGWELHCGDTFELLIADKWCPVRMEIGGGDWFLVGLPVGVDIHEIEGLEARSHD